MLTLVAYSVKLAARRSRDYDCYSRELPSPVGACVAAANALAVDYS